MNHRSEAAELMVKFRVHWGRFVEENKGVRPLSWAIFLVSLMRFIDRVKVKSQEKANAV